MRILLLIMLAAFSDLTLADDNEISILTQSQNPDALFRLYPTQNIFTLLKLNSRTGQIYKLQFGFDDAHRFVEPLCGGCSQLSDGVSKAGRFTLYPTLNIFTFILLDQDSGRTWQVDWKNETVRKLE